MGASGEIGYLRRSASNGEKNVEDLSQKGSQRHRSSALEQTRKSRHATESTNTRMHRPQPASVTLTWFDFIGSWRSWNTKEIISAKDLNIIEIWKLRPRSRKHTVFLILCRLESCYISLSLPFPSSRIQPRNTK
jgi:hypothetical protein